MDDKKKYIILKDGGDVPFSKVVSDCQGQLCVPTSKGENLTSVLKKICAKIQNTTATQTTIISSETYEESVGDGVTTSFTIIHNFNSKNVIVQIVDNTSNRIVYTGVNISNYNEVVVSFAQAPSSNRFKIIIKK
jgi:hypothetical protein